jgi:TetR/AcrR family transcriptional regulator
MTDERTPQQERSQARRTVILDAAARVFDRVGFGTASLSQIAAEAEVGQGLIYFYFRTKEAIALAVIEEQNARTFAVMSAEVNASSPMTQLIRASRGIGELLLRDAIVRAGIRLSLEQGVFAGPTSEFYDQWIRGVVDGFAAARATGELRSEAEPELLGGSIVAYFTGVQLVSNVRSGRQDLMRSLLTMWTVLLWGLADDQHRDVLFSVLRATFDANGAAHEPIASDAVT